MNDRVEPSVWYIAGIGICVLAVIMLAVSFLGAGDASVAIAAQ